MEYHQLKKRAYKYKKTYGNLSNLALASHVIERAKVDFGLFDNPDIFDAYGNADKERLTWYFHAVTRLFDPTKDYGHPKYLMSELIEDDYTLFCSLACKVLKMENTGRKDCPSGFIRKDVLFVSDFMNTWIDYIFTSLIEQLEGLKKHEVQWFITMLFYSRILED